MLLRRLGEELRVARIAAGLSTRRVGLMVRISHTQVRRIESGTAPHVDLDLLARIASTLGHELSLGVHPVGAPVRDKAHVALLGRFAARLHASIHWRTEVPIPSPATSVVQTGSPRDARSMPRSRPRRDSMTSKRSNVG